MTPLPRIDADLLTTRNRPAGPQRPAGHRLVSGIQLWYNGSSYPPFAKDATGCSREHLHPVVSKEKPRTCWDRPGGWRLGLARSQ